MEKTDGKRFRERRREGGSGTRRSTAVPAREGGFTLVELLVATTILLIFGAMAVAALSYGSQLWRSAHRRSYAYNVATVIFQQIDDDLSAAKSQFWGKDEDAFDTRIKFWVDHDKYVVDPGPPEVTNRRQRLRFVRGIPDEAANPRVRQAGDGEDNDGDNATNPDSPDEEYYNLKDDDSDDEVDEDLKPLEGMCEVAYLLGLGDDDDDGTAETEPTSLYRAVLGPIGEQPGSPPDPDESGMTFFHEADDDPPGANDDSLGTSERIDEKAVRLADNVLHFEVRLWTQYTTTWQLWDDEGERIEFARWKSSYEPETCGPLFTWDSDRLRGTDPEFDDRNTPEFLMDPGQPGFARNTDDDDEDNTDNENDETYVRDNVFPRAVMIVVVVDPSEEYPVRNPLRLREDIVDPGATQIPVRGNLPAHNERWPYIRIGDEWIKFDRFVPDELGGTFVLAGDGDRGVRGTQKDNHLEGEEVKLGYTFSRVFHDPASREYWGQ